MSKDDAFAMFLNVKGEEFLPLLQSNPSFQAMLAGANMAIDLDNILRSVDGDLFFAADGFTDKRAGYSILLRLWILRNGLRILIIGRVPAQRVAPFLTMAIKLGSIVVAMPTSVSD